MNARLKQLWSGVAAFFLSQPPARRWTILGVGIASMAIVLGLAWWVQRPLYRPLFTNLSPHDAAAIVDALRAEKVAFEIEDGGRAVLVPAERLYELRLELASRGLPAPLGEPAAGELEAQLVEPLGGHEHRPAAVLDLEGDLLGPQRVHDRGRVVRREVGEQRAVERPLHPPREPQHDRHRGDPDAEDRPPPGGRLREEEGRHPGPELLEPRVHAPSIKSACAARPGRPARCGCGPASSGGRRGPPSRARASCRAAWSACRCRAWRWLDRPRSGGGSPGRASP